MKKAILGTLAVSLLFLPARTLAQEQVDPQLIQQFRADLKQAIANSDITDQQKQQIEDDLAKIREARQDHKRRAARSALQDLKSQLGQANFKGGDKQKLQADLKQIWAARRGE